MNRFVILAGLSGLIGSLLMHNPAANAAEMLPAASIAPTLKSQSASALLVPEETRPLMVTYGPRSSVVEGDPNYRQTIFLRLPEPHRSPVFVHVFDADMGGRHDTSFNGYGNTKTIYRLYGGVAGSASGSDLLDSTEVGSSRSFDNRWVSLFAVDPLTGAKEVADQDGEMAMRLFRLEVEGLSGNDANAYDVTLSSSETEITPIPGARLQVLGATVRIPELAKSATARTIEVKLDVPPGTDAIQIQNFDAASADMALAGPFSTWPIAASGQGTWAREKIRLSADERSLIDRGRQTSHGRFAVFAKGGKERPNDLSIFAEDGDDNRLAIDLPVRLVTPGERPIASFAYGITGCRELAFDGSASRNRDGSQTNLSWIIEDEVYQGPGARHTFSKSGIHVVRLEARNGTKIAGDGARLNRTIYVKQPPVAAMTVATLVAQGAQVGFDAAASTGDARFPISNYRYDFGDGTVVDAANPDVTHIYQKPGSYTASVTISDGTDAACSTAIAQTNIVVNAAPIAKIEAGATFVKLGSATTFDGNGSSDADGPIKSYSWDFGDGQSASGASVSHAWQASGVFPVSLTVDDGMGVENSAAKSIQMVRVNAPPVAMIDAPKKALVGETVTFDGNASSDPDGAILSFDWTIAKEGTVVRNAKGVSVSQSWQAPGDYQIKLQVEDTSGGPGRIATTEHLITVSYGANIAPVANAGPDHNVVVGQNLELDGSGSADADGSILKYHWDFGDRGTAATPKVVHSWHEPGEYTVSLAVTDDGIPTRATATDTALVRVSYPVNAAPLADPGPDRRAKVGEPVIFDASNSNDSDGNIVAFNWDFGNGRQQSGEIARHIYWQPGTYEVTLSVTDSGIPTKAKAQAVIQVVIEGDQQ